VCEEFEFDPTLIATIPKALAKPPGDRGNFDMMVLKQLDAEFQSHVALIDENLASSKRAKAEQDAKTAELAGACKDAHGKEGSARAELANAQADKRAAETARKAAVKAVQQLGPELQHLQTELDENRLNLAKLREGPMVSFKALQNYTLLPATTTEPAEPVVKPTGPSEPTGPAESAGPEPVVELAPIDA